MGREQKERYSDEEWEGGLEVKGYLFARVLGVYARKKRNTGVLGGQRGTNEDPLMESGSRLIVRGGV